MSDQESYHWLLPMVCGLHDSNPDRIVTDSLLSRAAESRVDILTSPITNAHFRKRVETLFSDASSHQKLKNLSDAQQLRDASVELPTLPLLSHLDTSLVPSSITSQLVGVTSQWLDLASPDPLVAGISQQVLELEVGYAAFCGVDNIVVQGPRLYYGQDGAAAADLPRYARALQAAMDVASHASFYVRMPMFDHPSASDGPAAEGGLTTRDEFLDEIDSFRPEELDLLARWDAWNLIRSACKYSSRLFLALSIPMHITDGMLQARWFSEPVRIAILEKPAFLEDTRGNLGLSKPCREFLSRILRLKTTPWIILWDTDDVSSLFPSRADSANSAGNGVALDGPTPAEAAASTNQSKTPVSKMPFTFRALAVMNYLQHDQPVVSEVERYGTGYQDYLQVPLQPLADNLESMTYEVFEKDPVKYDLYEEAIAKALRDWKANGTAASGPDGKVVVTVAGAGRGPLVTRAMRASQSEGVPIDLWAVEKNPNAYVLLQKHNLDREKWNGAVHLVQSDMRSWQGPGSSSSSSSTSDQKGGKIDILITELLGSFADNELSPECLDGILHHLSPQGISIPRSYTPFFTPISAPRIHADIMSRATWEPTAPETPAVVWLHSIDYLSTLKSDYRSREFRSPSGSVSLPPIAAEPNVQPVWTFHHGPQEEVPLKTSNKHNERFARLTFRCRHRGVCHGLGGYFESVLYPGVELSTNPNTIESKSKDMISWFPIFFPLKTPLQLPDNATLTVSVWRLTDGRKVWYEWMVESWMFGSSQQKIRLGQSEVHSSVKNGCLM